MKYFLDTEFIEAGRYKPITLISIGIVREDGEQFYAVSADFRDRDGSDWVKSNVLPRLWSIQPIERQFKMPVAEIALQVRAFIGDDKPEFWGYYADYDWVVFCQMFGAMIDLPKGWPRYCHDLKQLADEMEDTRIPKQGADEHNALRDAYWNWEAYRYLDGMRTRPIWNGGL